MEVLGWFGEWQGSVGSIVRRQVGTRYQRVMGVAK